MKDGMISLDSEFGKKIGFTSDKFHGYLWRAKDTIIISLITSLKQNQGNLSKLLKAITDSGYYIAVPNPFPRMKKILKAKSFKGGIINDPQYGIVEVWTNKPEE